MTSALENLFAMQLDYPDRKLSPNARGNYEHFRELYREQKRGAA